MQGKILKSFHRNASQDGSDFIPRKFSSLRAELADGRLEIMEKSSDIDWKTEGKILIRLNSNGHPE